MVPVSMMSKVADVQVTCSHVWSAIHTLLHGVGCVGMTVLQSAKLHCDDTVSTLVDPHTDLLQHIKLGPTGQHRLGTLTEGIYCRNRFISATCSLTYSVGMQFQPDQLRLFFVSHVRNIEDCHC